MKTPFDVRVLRSGDIASLKAMLVMFGRAFHESATYTAQQPDDEYLDGLLASSTFVAVAALCGGNVIGGTAAYLLPKFEQARSELYIYDLAVDAHYRRQGVATAMIAELNSSPPSAASTFSLSKQTAKTGRRSLSIQNSEYGKMSCTLTLRQGRVPPNPSIQGRPQAGFDHLRPPFMSNVRRQERSK